MSTFARFRFARARTISLALAAASSCIAAAWPASGLAGDDPQLRCEHDPHPRNLAWPLIERREESNGDKNTRGQRRSGVWNSAGEFQRFRRGSPEVYLHTGIDIRGRVPAVSSDESRGGDWVMVPENGYVWAVPHWDGDQCRHIAACRIYVKSEDRERIHYFSHLAIRGSESSDVSTDVRRAIETVRNRPAVDGVIASAHVLRGSDDEPTVLASLGSFQRDFTHLHYGIFDACDNYNLINPLMYLEPPSGYVDTVPPKILDIALYPEASDEAIGEDYCAEPLKGVVDVVAHIRDAYRPQTSAALAHGTDSIGVFRSDYELRRRDVPQTARYHYWYQFDRLPLRCASPYLLEDCDVVGTDVASGVFDQDAFVALAGLGAPGDATHDSAPRAGSVAERIFRYDPRAEADDPTSCDRGYSSSRFTERECHHYAMNTSWGQSEPLDTRELADGLYELRVRAQDAQYNLGSRSRWVRIDNSGQGPGWEPGVVVRDHAGDIGASPSVEWAESRWRSPDIVVREVGSGGPSNIPPEHGLSELSVPSVVGGRSYEFWVRVHPIGCETSADPRVAIAVGPPQTVHGDWQRITGTAADPFVRGALAAGSVIEGATWVGPIVWEAPGDLAGPLNVIAAATSDRDPFDSTDIDWDGNFAWARDDTIAIRNDIAQLHLVASEPGSIFELSGLEGIQEPSVFEFSCNDYPMHRSTTSARLIVAYHEEIFAKWATAIGTRAWEVDDDPVFGRALIIIFEQCQLALPAVLLRPGEAVAARFDLRHRGQLCGSYPVDLGQIVLGVGVGGVSANGGDDCD